MADKNLQNYWKKNLNYLYMLLGVWFLVSYGAGIFLKMRSTTLRSVASNWAFGSPSRDRSMYLLSSYLRTST